MVNNMCNICCNNKINNILKCKPVKIVFVIYVMRILYIIMINFNLILITIKLSINVLFVYQKIY